MTSIINASVSSNGIVSTADASGILQIQSNGVNTNAQVWVNFGYVSSAITIRASYNVSSVTRTSAGLYVVNFTNAMPDTNFVALCTTSDDSSAVSTAYISGTWPTNESTSKVTVQAASTISGADRTYMGVAVFR